VLWWGWTGHAAYDSLKAKTDADTAKAAQQIAESNAKASEAAREEEQTRARYIAGIDAAYQKGLNDAKRKADAVAADLRSGNLRLRHELAALAARGVPGSPVATGEPEGAAERGAELAGAAVGVGAQCDARIAALIAAYDAANGQHTSRPGN
jgi:hypothetical protein